MTHVTCRLTAKNRDQLRNPTLGNRVRAAFTFCTGGGATNQRLPGDARRPAQILCQQQDGRRVGRRFADSVGRLCRRCTAVCSAAAGFHRRPRGNSSLLQRRHYNYITHTHARTHPFNDPFSRFTRVSWYQKGKTSLDFTEARDSAWQWHQLGHMQVCISLQTDNHASSPPLKFFTGQMPFLPPNQQCQSTEGTSTIQLY